MPDLVGDYVFERCENVFLRLGAVGRDLSAGDEQIERERELIRRHLTVFAERRIALGARRLRNPRRELLGGRTPRHARPTVLNFDIRIENLTGPRIGTAWADRKRTRF